MYFIEDPLRETQPSASGTEMYIAQWKLGPYEQLQPSLVRP